MNNELPATEPVPPQARLLNRRRFLQLMVGGTTLGLAATYAPQLLNYSLEAMYALGEDVFKRMDEEISQALSVLPTIKTPQNIGLEPYQVTGQQATANQIRKESVDNNSLTWKGCAVITTEFLDQHFCQLASDGHNIYAIGIDGFQAQFNTHKKTFEAVSVANLSYADATPPSTHTGNPWVEKYLSRFFDIQVGTEFLNTLGYTFFPTIRPDLLCPETSFLPTGAQFVTPEQFLGEYDNKELTLLLTPEGFVLDQAHVFGFAGKYHNLYQQLHNGAQEIQVWGFTQGYTTNYQLHKKLPSNNTSLLVDMATAISHHDAVFSEYMQHALMQIVPKAVQERTYTGLNFEDTYTNNLVTVMAHLVAKESPRLLAPDLSYQFRQEVASRLLQKTGHADPNQFPDLSTRIYYSPGYYSTIPVSVLPLAFTPPQQLTTPTAAQEGSDFSVTHVTPFQSGYSLVKSRLGI